MSMTIELIDEMLAGGFMTEAEAEEARAAARGEEAPAPVPEGMVMVDLNDADIDAHAEREQERKALYEEAESDVTVPDAPVVAPEPAAAAIVKAATARRSNPSPATRAPRRDRRLADGETVGDYVARVVGGDLSLIDGAEAVPAKALVDGITAVKVREKAVDLIEHVRLGNGLSVFTKIGAKMLKEKGKCTSAELARRMMDGVDGKNYTDGTARAQAQQVFSIFKTFKVVDENGTANENSVFGKELLAAV